MQDLSRYNREVKVVFDRSEVIVMKNMKKQEFQLFNFMKLEMKYFNVKCAKCK